MKGFEKILAETLADHCSSGLYNVKYHQSDQIMEDIRRLGTPSVLDSSPYENFILHTRQAYNKTSQRRRTLMTETVSVMDRS